MGEASGVWTEVFVFKNRHRSIEVHGKKVEIARRVQSQISLQGWQPDFVRCTIVGPDGTLYEGTADGLKKLRE